MQVLINFNHIDNFFDATESQFFDFLNWKSETDVMHIELDGLRFRVETVSFRQYLIWRIINELSENEPTPQYEVEFEAEYEMLN